MKFYDFTIATTEDIESIVEIEKKYFEKSVAYTSEFIRKWIDYNPNMFYVVKDRNNNIKAFTILVPITEVCFNKLSRNEINDMNQFEKSDVLQTAQSEFYYFADIATFNKDPLSTVSLLNGIQKYLCNYAHYVAATPITDDGLRISKIFGFGPILERGKNCFVEITPEIKEKYQDGFEKRKKR